MKMKTPVLALWFSLALPSLILAYDQVQFEKGIPLTSKKAEPSILRQDDRGDLWILDRNGSSIQKLGMDGKPSVVLKPGKKPADLFREPVDFVFMNNGDIAVADAGLNRIAFIRAGADPSSDWRKPVLLKTISVQDPSSIAVSHDDIVVVGFPKEGLIRFYSVDGVPLHSVTPPEKDALKSVAALGFSPDGTLWAADGEAGKVHRFSSDRKWLGATDGFSNAQSLVVDDFGYAYVTLAEGKWKELDTAGEITGTFGAKGKNPGQMMKPVGISTRDGFRLWVAESANNRVQLFKLSVAAKKDRLLRQPSSRLQIRLGARLGLSAEQAVVSEAGTLIHVNRKKSSIEWLDANGKVTAATKKVKGTASVVEPTGIALDRAGGLWVTDASDHKIKKVTATNEVSSSIGEKGKKEGSLKDPTYLQVRKDGSFVVVDRGNSRVQVLSPKGLFLFAVGGEGKGKGQYKRVNGLAASDDLIALIDDEKKSLLFYDSTGKFLQEVANKDGASPVWRSVSAVTADPEGRFFVLDAEASRVRVFDHRGRFIADFSTAGRALAAGPGGAVFASGERETQAYQVAVVPRGVEELAIKDQSGYLKLSWKPDYDSVSYRVYRSSAGGQFQLLSETTETGYSDGALVPSVIYRYAVSGVNRLGYEGNWTQSDPLKASRRKDISLVSITSTSFDPVFSAAFKYYATSPIGYVTVKNNDDVPYRNLKLSLSLRRYADFATESPIPFIEAGGELRLPVTMTFNDTILELTENTPVQLDVRLVYFEDNAEKVVSQNAPLMIYSRNAISWKDKARISSFITPRDVPIVDFSRAAIKEFIGPLKTATIGKPLAKAVLLYESVNALGMAYVPDPKTPFAEVSGKPDVLDYVQYPRETLRRKLGDCDDTTALLSSLLESIGVETALVESPGHIFLMANLEENDPEIIGLPIERFVDYRGTYWVPIETTQLGKDFNEAWQTAIATIRKEAALERIEFIPIIEASKIYPPITLVDKETESVAFPTEKVRASFSKILQRLQNERYDQLVKNMKAQIVSDPGNAMLQIQMGMIHVEGGRVDEGKKIFEAYLNDESVDVQAAAHNNLGNLKYLSGDFAPAAKHYEEAALLSPDDGGVAINRARTAWKLGDPNSAKKFLVQARELQNDWREYVGDLPAELLPPQ